MENKCKICSFGIKAEIMNKQINLKKLTISIFNKIGQRMDYYMTKDK
jgi:hypothetical protein